MLSSAFSAFVLSSVLISSANAIMIPLRRAAPSRYPLSVSVSADPDQRSYGFSNFFNDAYTGTVYVQGHPFQVMLDSGSSDLWVQTTGLTLDGLINTTIADSDEYVGTGNGHPLTAGYVELANVTFGPYTVHNQAMLNAVFSNATNPIENQGILGISSASISNVAGRLSNTSYASNSKPFLINLFETNGDIEPYYAVHLSRSNGSLSAIEGGSFAIGEVIEECADVLKAPQVPIQSDQGWYAFMDGIHVGDEWVDGSHTTIGVSPLWSQPSSTQSLVVLDTGTSALAADPYFVDAVYKNIPGAQLDEDTGFYQIPCDSKPLNVSITLGGVSYPINPLDMISDSFNENGTFCTASWQYSIDADQDATLGDVFLRNVYTLFNLGNWTANHDYQPFVQLLSITNQTQALADYDALHKARIAEIEAQLKSNFTPSTVSLAGAQTQTWALSTGTSLPTATAVAHADADLAAADLESASSTGSQTSSSTDTGALARNEYIIMGLIAGVLVLLLGILAKLVQNGRSQQYRQVPTAVPVFNDKPYDE